VLRHLGLDPRRFTGHANVELTAIKAIEDHQNEFRFHCPHEHRLAGCPAKTTPLTPVLAAEGAEFTVVNGWERLVYIKPSPDFHPRLTFDFDEAFDVIGAEVRNIAENVGLTEVNGFNRIQITGTDRHAFLDQLICGTVTKRVGRVGLGYLLNHHGCIKAKATVTNLPASDRRPARVWYGSAAASKFYASNASLYAAYLALRKAGAAHGMKLFGARTVDSMRLEKGFLQWKADLITEFDLSRPGSIAS
jgi:dimethylglycine dehydrogenase